jgi:aminoglycoside phosphotransferase (APT) family kinase protein
VDDPLDAVDRAAEVNARFRPVEIDHDTVTRPATRSTPTVHTLLRHLRSRGVLDVPEPLGIQDGRESLRFVPGESGGDGWSHQHTDQGLASAARLLRRVHDAGADWVPPDDATWVAPPVAGGAIVFCHGDPGPWNFVWRDQEAVGLIDWDYLHPGPRLDDVAYALRWFVPLRADEHVLDWHHFPEVPDRGHRVRVFCEAYGELPAFDVADTVSRRMMATRDLMASLAADGVEPQRSWVADGALEREDEEIRWVDQHRHLW